MNKTLIYFIIPHVLNPFKALNVISSASLIATVFTGLWFQIRYVTKSWGSHVHIVEVFTILLMYIYFNLLAPEFDI
jgi:hypothetical protein